jgi:NTE family protein
MVDSIARSARLFLFLLAGLLPRAASAQTVPSPVVGADTKEVVAPLPDRPRIGLALSGGGARGIAHIGVLQVLEELRIPVDIVTGTSMGALVGGMYAAGMSPSELEAIVTGIDWPAAFTDKPPRATRSFRRKQDDRGFLTSIRLGMRDGGLALPLGIIQGQELELLMRRLLARVREVRDFDDLRIPFRAVATDIVTGEAVVMRDGDLVTALRASMSIPGAFEPVERDGRLLVDGMVVNNLPIAQAIAMGADVVIAVDVGTPLRTRDEISSAITVADQVLAILTKDKTQVQIDQLRPGDLLIRPDLTAFGNADFERADAIIPIGESAALGLEPELAALSASSKVYASWVSYQRLGTRAPPLIVDVQVVNDSRLGDAVAENAIDVPLGEPLDVAQLERGIRDLYGTDFFQRIEYQIDETPDGEVLLVRAREKAWGPRYLRVGVAIEENFDNTSYYGIGFNYTIMPTNEWGAEWRNEVLLGTNFGILSEWYQPLGDDRKWFVAPGLSAFRERFPVYDGDDRVGDVAVQSFGIGADIGRELGNWGELRVGVRWLEGRGEPIIGLSQLSSETQQGGGAFVRFATDTLDHAAFPTSGQITRVAFSALQQGFGSQENLELLRFGGWKALTYEKNTLALGFQGATTFDGGTNIYEQVRVGGLFRLSGLDRDQLAGRYAGVLRAVGYRRIATPGILSFTYPLYLGGSIEYGGAWRKGSDISWDSAILAGSVFLGLDSPIGPIYLAYGLAEGGQDAVYLFVGQIF